MDTEQFIIKSHLVHGGTYDYSLSDYTNNKVKIAIICEKHGLFYQTPNAHLSGKGCFKCKGKPVKTTETFISESTVKHAGKYTYGKTRYVNVKTKVLINCCIHGDFEQRPDIHLSGHGCPYCAKKQRPISNTKTTMDFVLRSTRLHCNKYDYSLVKYKSNKDPVQLVCSTHGVFHVTPTNHLRGQGCPSCSTRGFNPTLNASVYVMVSECGSMMKIGITNNINSRLVSLTKLTPFGLSMVDNFDVPGRSARPIEQSVHSLCESSGLSGFNGATEWFKYDGEIIQMMRDLFT